jgi:DNA uptake protein ComE-like DNA-binding protein
MNFFEQKKRSYKEWFEFSRKEQRGVIALSVLILLMLTARMMMIWLSPAAEGAHLNAYEMVHWVCADSSAVQHVESSRGENKERSFPDCFPFDPNNCTVGDWMRLGLSEKQAAAVNRFCSSGAVFRSISDLERVYVFPDGFVSHIEPCILWSNTQHARDEASNAPGYTPYDQFRQTGTSENPRSLVEINSADTSELIRIPGIGRYFARKIYNYRKKLGGFYETDQLLEVHRMTPSKLDSIARYIVIDTAAVSKIRINEVDAETLAAHPYISDREASALIAYRDKHGPFLQLIHLLDCKALDEKTFAKIRNYIAVP